MSQLFGVDVSEFQGVIDWDALNNAANFVIIRASFGTMRKDNQFDRNQSEARRVQAAAGPLGIGYYYYAYPTLVDAVSSANYFVDNLGWQKGELVCLDLEGAIGDAPVTWSLQWLRQVENRLWIKPLIYLNQSIMNGYDWSPVVSNGYGLWVADYDNNQTSIPPSGAWPFAAIKQWTDAASVAGIAGKVDSDTFFGDFNAWAAYGGQISPTPPAPQPQPAPPQPPTPEPPQPNPTPPPTPTPPPSPAPSFWQRLIAWLKRLLYG